MKIRFVRNGSDFRQAMGREREKIRKAAIDATKVEGYRLMRLMKDEIRAGAPGGQAFAPLSVLRLGKGSGRKALSRLAIAPRYMALGQGETTKVMVGFLTIKSSKTWVNIAKKHQEGFEVDADKLQWGATTLRKQFARRGAKIKDESIRKYFFLRRSTEKLKTPPRDIVVPFWKAHNQEALRNIQANFIRKMKGERI